MIKLSNKLNLPAILVRAIANDHYTGGTASDYTTTSLLRPPRIAQLSRLHKEKLVEDASDRLWSLYGQIIHQIIERAATDELVEKRLFMTVAGKTVSGQVDLVHNKILADWKFVTRYATKEGIKPDWVAQGQINRLLCHENGIEIEKIEYTALYRDYSVMAAARDKDYPESPVQTFPIALWPLDKTRAFVEERIALHEAAKIELPLCTDEERFADPPMWALMCKGKKRALRLYETEAQAEAGKKNHGTPDKCYVEYRPSINKRCLYFCQCAPWCTQFREMMQDQAA